MFLKKCRSYLLLLLVLMIRGSLCVPALDVAPPAATPNTIEESDKLLEGSGETGTAPQDGAPTISNETIPPATENSETAVVSTAKINDYPERVRRATEFVRNAIRKYRQLQKLVEASEAVTELSN
uniref:Uncharacterized protein LOC108036994 n=1 Tax=Drosophila rhopaloa TaxID=1041015 RepID=A0A6P4E142_DRORH